MSKEQAKQTNDNQKCQKFCRELKEIQTKGESRQTMLERSVNSLLIDEFIKAMIKGFLKVLQNSRNICWFNSLMVSPMNTWGVSRAIELSECRRNKMWYEFRHLVKLLNINITRDKLDMKSLISAKENYFDGSPHFSLGRQEDAADFFWFHQTFLTTMAVWKVSVFGVILVGIFRHSNWIRRDTPYLSVFGPDAGKCGPE